MHRRRHNRDDEKMGAMSQAHESGLQDVDPAVLEVWVRRAAELARVPPDEDEDERTTLVIARLGSEMYAFDARHVFDIRPAGNITRVPRVPGWVAGITAVRGRILSILDLAAYFELPTAEQEREPGAQHLVLVETADMELCLLVDEVVAIASLAMDNLTEASDNLQGLPAEYVLGVAVRADAAVAPVSGLDPDLRLIDKHEPSKSTKQFVRTDSHKKRMVCHHPLRIENTAYFEAVRARARAGPGTGSSRPLWQTACNPGPCRHWPRGRTSCRTA